MSQAPVIEFRCDTEGCLQRVRGTTKEVIAAGWEIREGKVYCQIHVEPKTSVIAITMERNNQGDIWRANAQTYPRGYIYCPETNSPEAILAYLRNRLHEIGASPL